MATTTNYSWTTPNDTDLVKDGAAAIRTLGSSADTTVKNLNPGTTAGDIDYYTSSTAKARIAIGTAGQVLQVNAGATAPEWAAPAGGGKVLQVVSTTAKGTSSSTSTYVDHIALSITPASASNKILVLFNGGNAVKNGADRGLSARVTRAGTAILEDICTVGGLSTTTDIRFGGIGCAYLDSPNTTSSTQYKIQIRSFYNNASVSMNPNDDTSTLTLLEIAG